jgi:SAM-dependent methyltransferase
MGIELADRLDALIGDPEATQRYADYVLSNTQHGKLLELACGTGALAQILRPWFTIEGLDQDPAMIRQFETKNPGCITHVRNMVDLDGLGFYDGVLCFGDSLNYLTDPDDVDRLFAQVWSHLKPGGVFLFDAHTELRLHEFQSEFVEEGYLDGLAYQWSIQTVSETMLDHLIVFYDVKGVAQRYQILQRVYTWPDLKRRLERFPWGISVASDFVEGINPQAEKYMIACRKETS